MFYGRDRGTAAGPEARDVLVEDSCEPASLVREQPFVVGRLQAIPPLREAALGLLTHGLTPSPVGVYDGGGAGLRRPRPSRRFAAESDPPRPVEPAGPVSPRIDTLRKMAVLYPGSLDRSEPIAALRPRA